MSAIELNTDESRVSYGIGRQMGEQLRQNPPPGTDIEAVAAGLRDAFAGVESAVSQEALVASFAIIREQME
ncbi:MAG: FKBP-type peptidyl-prolyl cis-trans isomerase N-terminal domain-containing protein, partial [Thiopseudomonas sp.]